MWKIILFWIAVLWQQAATKSSTDNKALVEKAVNTLYSFADPDDDGIITQEEFSAVFKKFDLDDNGTVTVKEFVPTWQNYFDGSMDDAEAFFKMADVKRDGVLTKEDMTLLHKAYDTDGNGEITDREFIKKMRMTLKQIPFVVMFKNGDINLNNFIDQNEIDIIFSRFDNNRDQIIDGGEFVSTWTSRGYSDKPTAKRLFSYLDVNQDGELDQDTDMKGVFKLFDSNRDKQISQQEFVNKWIQIFKLVGRGPRL